MKQKNSFRRVSERQTLHTGSLARFLAQSALIAALYAVCTYISALCGLAYGSIQFRFAEALCILPVFTPAAVPGLTVGCLLANLGSALGPADWFFGTLATFLGAWGSYLLRHVQIKKLPVLSTLLPVVTNSILVGLELALIGGGFKPAAFSWSVFTMGALTVGAGELAACVGLGLPFYVLLARQRRKNPKLFTL